MSVVHSFDIYSKMGQNQQIHSFTQVQSLPPLSSIIHNNNNSNALTETASSPRYATTTFKKSPRSTTIKRPREEKSYAFISHSISTFPSNEPEIDNTQLARKKRRRTGPAELSILQQEFKICRNPSKQKRQEIGVKINMTEKAIQIWFQNKRQNERKLSQQRNKKKIHEVHTHNFADSNSEPNGALNDTRYKSSTPPSNENESITPATPSIVSSPVGYDLKPSCSLSPNSSVSLCNTSTTVDTSPNKCSNTVSTSKNSNESYVTPIKGYISYTGPKSASESGKSLEYGAGNTLTFRLTPKNKNSSDMKLMPVNSHYKMRQKPVMKVRDFRNKSLPLPDSKPSSSSEVIPLLTPYKPKFPKTLNQTASTPLLPTISTLNLIFPVSQKRPSFTSPSRHCSTTFPLMSTPTPINRISNLMNIEYIQKEQKFNIPKFVLPELSTSSRPQMGSFKVPSFEIRKENEYEILSPISEPGTVACNKSALSSPDELSRPLSEPCLSPATTLSSIIDHNNGHNDKENKGLLKVHYPKMDISELLSSPIKTTPVKRIALSPVNYNSPNGENNIKKRKTVDIECVENLLALQLTGSQ